MFLEKFVIVLGATKLNTFNAAIVANPQRPGAAADIDISLETADGIDAAVALQPDHQLVVARRRSMVDIPCREQVIRHIRADISVTNTPLRSSRHGGDPADKLLIEVLRGVGVALDVVLPAVPLPGRGLGDGGAGRGVKSRALRA